MGSSRGAEPFDVAAARSRAAYERALAEDLLFLQAWEQGMLPSVGATVRIRQIRRALAALPSVGTAAQ